MSRQHKRTHPTTTVTGITVICITGSTASVANVLRALLDNVLACVVTRIEPGGPLGHRHARELLRLWDEGADGTVTVPAGLVPRLVLALHAAGYRVEVEDLRRQEHAADGVREARGLLGDVLAGRLADEPRGLIEGHGHDAFAVVAGIARLFPTARVLVAARNRRQARAAFRSLRDLLGNEVGHWRDPEAFGRRVLVTTVPRLGDATPADFDTVVALDARAATRRLGRDGLVRLGCGRVYGCVPHDALLSRRERLNLEAYFGPVLHRDPAGGAFVGVRVVMALPPWSPPVAPGDALARKRALWNDAARNRFVADAAVAIAARNEVELSRLGLFGAAEVMGTNTAPRVAVLAESPEHGRILRRLLPGWALVIAGDPDTALPAKAVVTLVAAAEKLSVDADVLVRADGGPGPLDLRSFPPGRVFPGSAVLVLDLNDDFDSGARRNTGGRVEWYDGRGWPVSGRPSWTRAPGRRGGSGAGQE